MLVKNSGPWASALEDLALRVLGWGPGTWMSKSPLWRHMYCLVDVHSSLFGTYDVFPSLGGHEVTGGGLAGETHSSFLEK